MEQESDTKDCTKESKESNGTDVKIDLSDKTKKVSSEHFPCHCSPRIPFFCLMNITVV